MIALRPTSLRFRVLFLLVDDALTAEQLAAHLFPPPKLAGPLTSRAAWKERADAVAVYRREGIRKVSRALDALHAAGLVAPCGAPTLARWYCERIERYGFVLALHRAHPAFPRDAGNLAAHLRLVDQCSQGPTSTRALLGASPSGAQKRAYRELGDWGVIVPASGRVATAAGIALVGAA